MINIHERARQWASTHQIPIEEAYRQLSQRASAVRRTRRDYGRTVVNSSADLEAIEL